MFDVVRRADGEAVPWSQLESSVRNSNRFTTLSDKPSSDDILRAAKKLESSRLITIDRSRGSNSRYWWWVTIGPDAGFGAL